MTLPFSVMGSTSDSLPMPTSTCDGVEVTAPGRWYRIVGTGNRITASTCSDFTGLDARVNVYAGDCDGLTCVAGNDDDLCISGPSTVSWCSFPRVEYRILVRGADDAVGGFYMSVYEGSNCAPIDAFVQTADAANIQANWPRIDRLTTNGLPNSLLFVTQNFNPGGIGGTLNNAPVGVWHNGFWSVFNQGRSAMPLGASFNVAVMSLSASVFVHVVDAGNSDFDWTRIDHPSTDARPNAILLITQNWNPGGAGGTYNNTPVGVWYNGAQWTVTNEDRSTIPVRAAFNVAFFVASDSAFVHTTT